MLKLHTPLDCDQGNPYIDTKSLNRELDKLHTMSICIQEQIGELYRLYKCPTYAELSVDFILNGPPIAYEVREMRGYRTLLTVRRKVGNDSAQVMRWLSPPGWWFISGAHSAKASTAVIERTLSDEARMRREGWEPCGEQAVLPPTPPSNPTPRRPHRGARPTA